MKPKIAFGDLKWREAYERFRAAAIGSKYRYAGLTFQLAYVEAPDDPHPPRLEFTYRANGKQTRFVCSKGDMRLLDFQPLGGGEVASGKRALSAGHGTSPANSTEAA